MRNWVLLLLRQITSSRQSPKISAVSPGLALVPLFEATLLPVSRVLMPPVLHLLMVMLSSSSRDKSPSHQIAKLMDGVEVEICPPEGLRKPPREAHAS